MQQQNNETNQCHNHVDLCEKSCNSQIEHVFHRATLGEVENDASLQSTLQRRKDTNRTTNTANNNVTESNQKSIFIDDLPGQTTYCTGYEEQCNAVGNSNNEQRGECALDCSGELTGGCTLVDEWHLPSLGAEVVCIPDSMSNKYEVNNGEYYLTANNEPLNATEFKHKEEKDVYEQNYFRRTSQSKLQASEVITYTTKSIAEETCVKHENIQIPIINRQDYQNQSPPIFRRCSYEEIVHAEEENSDDILIPAMPSSTNPKNLNCLTDVSMQQFDLCDHLNNIRRCLVRLTQWALTLQEVYEDRETSGLLKPEHLKCVCARAIEINDHLSQLEGAYIDAIDEQDNCMGDTEDTQNLAESLEIVVQKQLETPLKFI